ncbi:U5 small nuclear ribonuclear protein, putative [Plasmodium ovale curtisi]|uniref:U5 small nuclear ribonuclear protein, putative n=1 Tax=Plasmodium ovale curtisi TaxID=864141 RepID=A0A1A8WFK3_PLAOA|nr:U5 small nuclear ribonuclear protein, putative [Plasmodium ovale curtisi]
MESKNNLYDEFGNYIGEDIDSDEEEYSDEVDESKDGDSEDRSDESNSNVESKDEEEEDEDDYDLSGNKDNKMDENDIDELKKIYDGAEVFIEEEDTQDIEQATINKINANVERISFIKKLDVEANRKNFDLVETSLPNNNFSFKYLSELMAHTNFIRNICIAGHFHHGKTTLVDRLIEYTREKTKGDSYFINKSAGGNNNNGSSSVSFFKLSDEFDDVIKKNTNESNSTESENDGEEHNNKNQSPQKKITKKVKKKIYFKDISESEENEKIKNETQFDEQIGNTKREDSLGDPYNYYDDYIANEEKEEWEKKIENVNKNGNEVISIY